MEEQAAVAALIIDLQWQIEQMDPRGIKNAAGNPYNPSYYKRGLQVAIDTGGLAVPDYIRRYLSKPPSNGYKKLEEANSLDLACEALIADPDKPYAQLFSDADRAAARSRLAPHLEAIESRNTARTERIAAIREGLPKDLETLRERAAGKIGSDEAIAIGTAILDQDAEDKVALNRLGRAYETIGAIDSAKETFKKVLEVDSDNAIARRRLQDLERRHP